jgi:hypothetical protein
MKTNKHILRAILLSALAFACVQFGRYYEQSREHRELTAKVEFWQEQYFDLLGHSSLIRQKEVEFRLHLARAERRIRAHENFINCLADNTYPYYLPAADAVRRTFITKIAFDANHLPDSLLYE